MREIALNVNPRTSLGKAISMLVSGESSPSVHNVFSLSAFQSLLNRMFYLV